MDKIDCVMVESLQNAKFVKPYRLTYSQNNIQKTWEVISVHPSVSVLIFNIDRKKLVLVRQFRPAVYFSNYPRDERELTSSTVTATPAEAHSAATQSAASQATQHTQTAPRSISTQETQTNLSHQPSEVLCDRPNSSQSTQATQSTEVIKANQCVQSDIRQSISASTQSSSLQCCQETGSASNAPHGSCAGRKTLPSRPGAGGLTLELCAGIVDKDVPLCQIAREEVLEECGYNVSAEALEQVITYRSGVGASGDRQTLFFVEVTDAMKVSDGGGLAAEGELIEVVELGIPEIRALLQQQEVLAPGGFLFALMWFLTNKADQYQ